MIKRREFITLLGGAAAWPLAARAQQGDRVRRIGVLMPLDENDPLAKTYVSAFTQALAQELVGLQPDIILTGSTAVTAALQRETPTIPIVFVNVGDPVASGIVARLDRPMGTAPASASWKPRWEASGLNCSRRSRQGSSGPESCSIPTPPPYRLLCLHLRRRPGHSRSS